MRSSFPSASKLTLSTIIKYVPVVRTRVVADFLYLSFIHSQAPDRGRSILDAPYAYEANHRRTPSPEPKAFEYDDVTPEKMDKAAPWHRPTPMSPKNRSSVGLWFHVCKHRKTFRWSSKAKQRMEVVDNEPTHSK